MSHFSVIVCIDDPGKLEAVLAPFDENLEVEPYRDYEDGGPASHWAVKSLREQEGLNPDDATLTWAELAAAHNRRYSGDDETPLLVDESGRAYQMSTSNPRAKWDWYQVGGRMAGHFPYAAEHAAVIIGGSKGHCDGGPKYALDLDRLRAERAAEAQRLRAEYLSLIAGHPEPVPWSVFADNISEGNGYTIEQARREYHGQPAIVALADTDFRWHDDPVTEFAGSEELYIEKARAGAVPGWATVTTDGRWMEQGRMGWFAMSDATDDSRIGYWEAANAYIESLPGSTFLITVDCHI